MIQSIISKHNILIVEDDLVCANAILSFLEESDITSTILSEGKKVINYLQSQDYDLIVLDINLRDSDGVTVCKEIKTETRFCDIPIVFLTSSVDSSSKMKAFEAGATDYLIKPLDLYELKARISTHINAYRNKQQLQTLLEEGAKDVKKSENKYSELVKNFPNGAVLLFDKDLRYQAVGGAGLEKVGLSSGMLEGKTIWEVFDDQMANRIEPGYRKALNGISSVEEKTYSEYIYRSHILPIKDSASNVVAGMVMIQNITEEKQAIKPLERNAVIVNTTSDAIVTTDFSGIISSWNNGAEVIFEYSEKEISGESVTKLFDARTMRIISSMMRDLINQKDIVSIELSCINKRGQLIDTILTLTPVKDSEGNIVELVGIFKDITHIKQTQNALAISDKSVRQILASTSSKNGPDFFEEMAKVMQTVTKSSYTFIGELAEDGEVQTIAVSHDGQLQKNFAYNLEGTPCIKLIGGSVCVHPSNVATLFQNDQILADLNIEGYIGTPILNHVGDCIGVLVSLYTEPLEETGFIESMFNIFSARIGGEMERLKYEKALIRSETQFHSIFDKSVDAIGVAKDGINVTMNRAYLELFGYSSKKEMVGKSVNDIIAPEEKNRVKYFANRREQGLITPAEYETIGLKKDGSTFDMEVHVSNYTTNENKYIQVILRDITERKKIQKELRAHQRNLEVLVNERTKQLKEAQVKLVQSEKMATMGQLTTGIAHELNNPLNIIRLSSFALSNDIKDILELISKYRAHSNTGQLSLSEIKAFENSIEVEFLEEALRVEILDIKEATQRSTEIVQGLQQFNGDNNDDTTFADLHASLDNTFGLMQDKLNGSVRVKTVYDKTIGLIPYQVGPLNQVFLNLMNNAVLAIPGTGAITVETQAQKETVSVAISDSGTGISKENLNKIFDPFFTTGKPGSGAGLGLSICRSIVKQHGGSIQVKSEEGVGSRFTVVLPKSSPLDMPK